MTTAGSTGLVIDASVVIGLLIDPGPAGEEAARVMSEARLHAPALLPFEVDNVLRRRGSAGRLSRAELALARDGTARLPIALWPFEVVAPRVAELGQALTSYDASYVALAEFLGAPLLTADGRIARAPGIRCEVRLIG